VTPTVVLLVSAFLASAVEMVEALTIVLALGVTRGWRSVTIGAAAAVAALTLVVAALGPALTQVPISALRLVVGTVLLVFGLQWLRKAILRSAGVRALHDEDEVFAREIDESRHADRRTVARLDWYAFTLSFKGVFLEGLEVAFIVVTFGSTEGHIGLAAAAAGAALIVVGTVGAFVHRPLSRVPENSLKFAVGVMLSAFGMFWSAEGAGVSWPGEDLAILGLIAFLVAVAFGLIALLRRDARTPTPTVSSGH